MKKINILNKYFSIENKNVIITGAAGFLGTEFVSSIVECGGNPICLDISRVNLAKLNKNIINNFNKKLLTFVIDITDEVQVRKFKNNLLKKKIKVDALVNNAAINPIVEKGNKIGNLLENYPLNLWNKELAVSLTGAFLMSKHIGDYMFKYFEEGLIINISSDLGLIAPNQNIYNYKNGNEFKRNVKPVTYSVSKHGLIGLTRYLSTYWPASCIRSIAICPGGVERDQSERFKKELIKLIPMSRMAKKNEISGMLLYLLSNSSSYINGSIISIDGGRTVW